MAWHCAAAVCIGWRQAAVGSGMSRAIAQARRPPAMCPPHVEERCLCEPFDLVAIKQTEQSVWLEQVDTGVVVGAPAVASVLPNTLVLADRVHRRYHSRTRQRELTDSAARCRLRWKRDGELGALVELKGEVEGVGPARQLAVQERIRGKPSERQRRRVGGGLPLRHRASDDETPWSGVVKE